MGGWDDVGEEVCHAVACGMWHVAGSLSAFVANADCALKSTFDLSSHAEKNRKCSKEKGNGKKEGQIKNNNSWFGFMRFYNELFVHAW